AWSRPLPVVEARGCRGEGRTGVGDLPHGDELSGRVEPEPAVRARNRDPDEVQLDEAGDEVRRVGGRLVAFGGPGDERLEREGAERLAEALLLLAELVRHLRPPGLGQPLVDQLLMLSEPRCTPPSGR